MDGGGIAGKFVGEVGVGREADSEEPGAKEMGGAGDIFGGCGAWDDREQCVGAIGLEDSGAEQIEPPGFAVGAL